MTGVHGLLCGAASFVYGIFHLVKREYVREHLIRKGDRVRFFNL